MSISVHDAPTNAARDHLLPFLSAAEVARILNISARTVRRIVRDGRLAAVSTSAVRGRLRISREALAAFLDNAAVSLPATKQEVGR